MVIIPAHAAEHYAQRRLCNPCYITVLTLSRYVRDNRRQFAVSEGAYTPETTKADNCKSSTERASCWSQQHASSAAPRGHQHSSDPQLRAKGSMEQAGASRDYGEKCPFTSCSVWLGKACQAHKLVCCMGLTCCSSNRKLTMQ